MKKLIFILFLLVISSCSVNNLTGKSTWDVNAKEGPFLVLRAVDGDTIELSNGEKVRFSGINTPEKGECFYQQAKDQTNKLLTNKTIYLEHDFTDKDKYDRILRYVILNDENINILLVEQGYAKVYDKYKDDTKLYEELKEHEQIAISKKLGVWSCTDNFDTCNYVASKNSDKYHTASCKYALKIKPENQVCYQTQEQAKLDGKEFSGC